MRGATHVMDGMETIVASKPIDHRTHKVPCRVDVHVLATMLAQDNGFAAIVLKHVHSDYAVRREYVRNEPAQDTSTPVHPHQVQCKTVAAYRLDYEANEGPRALLELLRNVLALQLHDSGVDGGEEHQQVQQMPFVLHLRSVKMILFVLGVDVVVLIMRRAVGLHWKTKQCREREAPDVFYERIAEDVAVHCVVHHGCNVEGRQELHQHRQRSTRQA
mmetsp:Transcript_35107/g.73730  ORF Transcript_35107/g.73730 Transcript_35107/m.73730 type:complete len:217 (-) Transcript_35107:84-734(-)